MRASVNGCDILLTPREFAVLLVLICGKGKPVSAAELYTAAWGMNANDELRAVRKQISRLREKLNKAAAPNITIETLYGQGYLLRIKRGDEL